MMRRWISPSLVFAVMVACGGQDTSSSSTALLLEVDYPSSGVDTLDVHGTVLAQSRAFGPFMAVGPKAASGSRVALMFDPGDQGDVHVCVEARRGDGVRASGCATFAVQAGQTVYKTIVLQDGSDGTEIDGTGMPTQTNGTNFGAPGQGTPGHPSGWDKLDAGTGGAGGGFWPHDGH